MSTTARNPRLSHRARNAVSLIYTLKGFAHTDIPAGETTPKTTTPRTPSKRKAASSEDNLEATSKKKVTTKAATPKAGRAKKPVPVDNSHLGDDSMDEGFLEDASGFIKGETKWEDGFA